MTAFAIHIGLTTATVASNTLARKRDRSEAGPMWVSSNVLALPHQRTVIFGAGFRDITVAAAAYLTTMKGLRSVEDAADAMGNALRRAADVFAATSGLDRSQTTDIADVVMIGWSRRRKRMLSFGFQSVRDYETERHGALLGYLPFPRIPSEYIPPVDGEEKHRHLVRIIEAIDDCYADKPEASRGIQVGGEVIATTVTPTGISQKIIHRFETGDLDASQPDWGGDQDTGTLMSDAA